MKLIGMNKVGKTYNLFFHDEQSNVYHQTACENIYGMEDMFHRVHTMSMDTFLQLKQEAENKWKK